MAHRPCRLLLLERYIGSLYRPPMADLPSEVERQPHSCCLRKRPAVQARSRRDVRCAQPLHHAGRLLCMRRGPVRRGKQRGHLNSGPYSEGNHRVQVAASARGCSSWPEERRNSFRDVMGTSQASTEKVSRAAAPLGRRAAVASPVKHTSWPLAS